MRKLKIATEDRLHSAESAAELLGVKPSTIRWWWTIGKLPRVQTRAFIRESGSPRYSLFSGASRKGKRNDSDD